MNKKIFSLWLPMAVTFFLTVSPGFSQEDILPFEPDDTLEEIRYKIDYNGYDFTVSDNWVYNMPKEKKERFFSRHQPLFPRTFALEAAAGGGEFLPRGLELPSSFDWRDYSGRSYIGPIRNQGSCGSCYAFGAAAAAEGTYNYAMGLYDENCTDFSESYIIWCLGSLPEYNEHFYGCGGADYDYMELEALTVEGIIEESDFPYIPTDPGSCSHWGDQTYVFQSWHRVDCADIEAIKTAIMTYGVVDAAVYAGSAFSGYDNGIYEDTNTSCDASPCYDTATNHAIALVGWDDNGGPGDGTGDGYWILRNSWGVSWGENGYMRIKYKSAAVSCAVSYLVYQPPSSPTPTPPDFKTPTPRPTATTTPWGYETPSPSPTATPTSSPPPQSIPFSEGFEITFDNGAPPGWTKEYISGTVDWTRAQGGYNGYPSVAHEGDYNARFFYDDYSAPVTRLISPPLDFNGQIYNANLSFWLAMEEWIGDQDILSVYYRTAEGASWNLLTAFTASLTSWTEKSLTLPEAGDGYRICFEGTANYGYGICLDDLLVTGEAPPPITPAPTPTPRMPPPSSTPTIPIIPTPRPTGSPVPTATINPLPTPFEPVTRSWQTDFNGDGASDIAVFRPNTGLWAIRGLTRIYFGANDDLPVSGDYDGNRIADIAVYRPDTGLWAVRGISRFYYGNYYDQPFPGDYNGDGSIDPAVFDEFSGRWAIRGVSRFYFGGYYDIPCPGYYDGSALCSAAIFRPETGLWAIRGLTRAYFGASVDSPVPGHYTGALSWSPAIFHSSTGLWAIRGITRVYYGSGIDEAVPADYTGTGTDRPGIFRSSSGLWALRGISRVYFGKSGDIPVTR